MTQRRRSMIFVHRATTVAAVALVSALLSFGARTLEPNLIADSKTMTGAIVGLLALLLSPVLGLLIWTSHSLFTDHQAQMLMVGRSIIRLDLLLRRYGPEAAPGLMLLHDQAMRTQKQFWPEHPDPRQEYRALRNEVEPMRAFFDSLRPASDEQKRRFNAATDLFSILVETQFTMIRSLTDPVPTLLMRIVVGWAAALFFSYGVQSPINVLTLVMVAIGAAAVASAVFLIFELSHPYQGLMTMSQDGFERLVRVLTESDAFERKVERS